MAHLPLELIRDLERAQSGEVRVDDPTRMLYSTDASIYQIQPLGVVFPRTQEDLAAAVFLAAKYEVPVLARGSGSSLAGQAIGPALILDTSRFLTRIVEVDPERRTAIVEPGVILSNLNRVLSKFGLVFGPDPSSADRATVGGSIANNATGAHSITYGMAADHLLSADVILADGAETVLEAIPIQTAYLKGADRSSTEAQIYHTAVDIRDHYAVAIMQRWPHVWRRASGYNLNYLLNWSPTAPSQWYGQDVVPAIPYPPTPSGEINLAPLIAGSEGTLAVIKQLTLNLVPRPKAAVLGVLVYESISEACDAVPHLLETRPSAVELIPGDLLRLARSIPAYERKLTFIQGIPEAILVVEYAGEEPAHLESMARRLGPEVLVASSLVQQKQVWDIRKLGLGILNSRSGDAKALSFIEDLTVPVDCLGQFVREMEPIMAGHGTVANYYGHASTGCLHIRPVLSIKDSRGVAAMRSIAEQAVELTLSLGGTVSGEHGDGLARSEWIERTFGIEIVDLFRKVKSAFDPKNLLNPGKILDAPPMDSSLRYGPEYRTQAWVPVMDFSSQDGLAGAIEMCNGAGVCRKDDGVMCPSFQVTREEMHSTRGRANLLRALISGKFPTQKIGEETVYRALDLCLACKGCKSECPSAVDLAKLKYEFVEQYYLSRPRRLRDYLFGYIRYLAPLGSILAPAANPLMGTLTVRKLFHKFLGLAPQRKFPTFASLNQVWAVAKPRRPLQPDVLFLTDTFSRYFHPETEAAGLRVLETLGLHVQVIPVMGSGRTLISKGFVGPARRQAVKLFEAISRLDPEGCLPVVGVEPSEIATLRDEFLDFFPGDPKVRALSKRAWMVDEFLVRPGPDGIPRISHLNSRTSGNGHPPVKVLLHGHCYQKAQPPSEDGYPTGVPATVSMLQALGYQVEVVDSGCCGMAGAFGYEAEHYDLSVKVGELALFPTVRKSDAEAIVVAAGTSCRSQIKDGTDREAVHPICLVG